MVDKLVISGGHSKYVRGAAGYIDEVDEARKVVSQVTEYLKQVCSSVYSFNDDVSRTVNDNLARIVAYHNSKNRELDVSVHFNAGTKEIGGTEVYYTNPDAAELAAKVSKAISGALGIKDRGAKKRDNLYFLNGTKEMAILIEVCFVDTKSNAEAYKQNFDKCCLAIAETLSGKQIKNEKAAKVMEVTDATKNAIENLSKYGIMKKDYEVTKDYEVPLISMMNGMVEAIETGKLKAK